MAATGDSHNNPVSSNDLETDKKDDQLKNRYYMEYSINEIPPIHIGLLLGAQQVITQLSTPLAYIYIIHSTICTEGRDADILFAKLMSTTLFMMGVASFIQCTFGVRLPIVQGSSGSFIPPVIAMMATEKWKCPAVIDVSGNYTNMTTSDLELVNDEPWIPRLREISGCLMASAVVQVCLGCSGVIGLLLNYIGPLTICPTLALIGLSLFPVLATAAQHQWGIALLAVGLVVIFSQILGHINMPIPTWTKKKGVSIEHIKMFRIMPHMFAITISWLLCYILTVANVLPDKEEDLGYFARTDVKLQVLDQAGWFIFPYPFQWGTPTFSVGLFVGLLGSTFASVIESVGDYHATAKSCMLPPPPRHGINRGIAAEGFAGILSGLVGAANATTSYSQTAGFIKITGVSSRFVWQVMSVMFIVCGVFGKFGAALTIIPNPIIGALGIIGIGMVVSSGLSMLQFVDLNSPRNHLILAIPIMLGLMVPFWMKANPGVINTGSENVDQLIEIFLNTGMFIAGVLAFILDNIIPGTKEERGFTSFHAIDTSDEKNKDSDTAYDLPLISNYLRRVACCAYVPIMPSYTKCNAGISCCKRSGRLNANIEVPDAASPGKTSNYGAGNANSGFVSETSSTNL